MASTLNILVVDNYAPQRSTLRRTFACQGYAVTEAGDGEAALRKLATKCYDAVLLDEHLPGRNGLEVLAAARQQGCEAAIIVLTADMV